jgi:pyruvate/2-oxoacid:ferredoxin oxidoreductase alpha subunit/ferredoxin
MNEIIEKLAYKIGEGFQASSVSNTDDKINAFHRTVTVHESSDISFMNGLVATGLRGTALLEGDKIITNYNQFLTAARQHLPLVVNTTARLATNSAYSSINNFGNINAIQQTGCFQLVATSLQEEIFFSLIAHRITELSLIPGIVISDYTPTDEKVGIPADDLIKKYLGNPDDQIDCPTPSQKMIFGATRRRIPNWYSLDIPVMLGAKKDGEAISFEAAASQKYFYNHLPQLINQAYQEFNDVFGTSISAVNSKGTSSENAVITVGGQINEISSTDTQIITVNQLNPFPTNAVAALLKGKKAITILENVSGTESKSAFYYNVINALNNSSTKVYSGKYSTDLDANSLEKAIQHMVSGNPKMDYYLGLEFTKTSSSYPKHDILLKEIGKQYPEITSETINSPKNSDTTNGQSEVPLAVRMYQDKGPAYSRLSRFYDDTAFFYDHNEHNELVADPFAAVPVAPSASASFFSQTDKREALPIVDVKKLTGDDDAFVQCPHSALLPIVIGVEGLMKSGIDIASSKGATITKLTPMLKNLAKVAAKIIGDADITTVADFLPAAFESLATQMNLDGEKLDAAQSEFNLVLTEIGKLPVAVTDTFFNQPNAQEQGSGELFSLAVNPSSCTGCGICAQVSDAISMEAQETENLAKITEQFKLWEQLPDTSGETINRLVHDDNYSSLSAMLLSRSYFMSMSGASNSESDNPYKTLLHIVTATTESVVQPKIVSQIKRIDELIDSLSENVHKKLSQSLPKENLEQLSKSLKKVQGRKLSFQEVVAEISGKNKLIDTKSLGRKTDLVDSLKNLKWVLSEGPTGVGRSRYGMLIAGENSMDWAKQYPLNNFTNPSVIHWNGSAPEQTLGLFHGQLRYLLDNIKLMRRAALEAKDKYDTAIHDLEIAELNWNDLTDDEKKLVPPVLLVAERDDLNEAGWSSLNKLLTQKYPVKVFLFDNITSPNNSPVASLTQTTSVMFSSMALKSAFVFQGGMGNVNHLFDGLMTGLDKTYPALFNLYATKSEKHGVTNIDWSPYAVLALNSRAFPAISFNPEDAANFLNGAINLDGNNIVKADWITENIAISDEERIDYKITWADWAYTQSDWKDEFTVVKTDDKNVLIAEYIQLDAKGRNGKTPVIMRASINGLKYYAASYKVIEMTEAVLTNWNTLQELAGVVAKIPSQLKEELTKEISSSYEQQLVDLKKDYEQQLADAAASQTEVLRQQLKEKLVALSTMAKN